MSQEELKVLALNLASNTDSGTTGVRLTALELVEAAEVIFNYLKAK